MRSSRRQKSVSSKKATSKSNTRSKVTNINNITQYGDQSSDEEEKSRKPIRNNRSMARGKSSQIAQESRIVFKKGTFVAFVDPSDVNDFKIGQLLNDLTEGEDEALLDIFAQLAPLVYQKEASRQPVPEYTIICDINATLEKPHKKGAKPQLKIVKQQHNKANKLMDAVVNKIEQQSSEDDDDEEDDDEDDSEEEEESTLQKDDLETIKNRRMIKGRSSKPPNTQPKRTQSVAKSQKAKSAKKPAASKVQKSKSSSKSPSKKSKKGQDEEMDEEEEKEEQSEEIVMIDTSKKRAGGRQQPQKKAESLPQVGKKRLRQPKKQAVEESGEPSFIESSHHQDDEGSFDEEDSRVVKKRKVSKGKEKVIKPKKAAKKPAVFKKGRWNPDIELVNQDKYKESDSNDLYLDCCIRCNNKNIIRAAITNNDKLLKKGIEAKKKISSLTAYWSPEVKMSALHFMISKNLHDQLEILLHPKVKVPAHSTYEQQRDVDFRDRVNNPQYLMNVVSTGMVSNMAYGARVRKVQMTRGNRQGDNAFLEYIDNPSMNPVLYTIDQSLLIRMLYTPTTDYETFQQIYKLNPQIENYLQSQAYEAVRAGNRRIAYELIKNMFKYPNFGFNQLHMDVLSTDAPQPDKILKQSVTKKANTNKDITPLHCACINPNPKYLKMLLDANSELTIVDQDLRKLVHYAAACEGPEPLKVLIQAGASLIDQDNQKRTCLHIAAMTGRAHNVRTILSTAPNMVNQRDKKSMTPMAYACKFGHIEVVKVLLEFKIKINVGCGIERMPPLAWAAAYGHYDLCLFLLDNKGRTLGKDKYKRTPLIMAVRNGHTKIASLLLQRGSEWNHPDSSNNTPLHYAAAYGWLDCIELLLKAGSDVNAQNSWKNSPINIAMLKNHQGCVKRLLEEPNVDVNGKDEKGRTLLMLSLYVLEEDSEDFISFLLKKGADPNIADLEGETALHYLAKYVPKVTNDINGQPKKAEYLKQVDIQKKVTQLLILNGADLTIKDNLKRTPFAICLETDNAPLLEFLKDRVSINKEPEILFAFKDKIFNIEYQKILERLILNDPPLKETINTLDDQGFTPFLRFVKSFADNYNTLFTNIQNRINQQSFIYADDVNKYKITNQDLFDRFADQTNFYTYNYNFNQEQKNNLTRKFLDEIIAQPFVKILKFLLSQGADEHSTVDKMKKYRDLELLQKQNLQQLAQGHDIKMEKEEDKIKKREEKLKEMNQRKVRKGKKTSRAYAGGGIYGGFGQPAIQEEAAQDDVYEKIDGKKVLREFGPDGKRNAFHLIIKVPQQTLFHFLLSLKIDPDQPDYDQVTPFNLMSKNVLNRQEPFFKETFDKMLDLEVRIDYPDNKGRTPFLNFYDQQHFDLAYMMLDLGGNVNQMDTSGLFALKYALIRRHNSKIQELLDRGANINQIDNKGRNLLHHAINMSSATADATFETEQFLIERGVEINHTDNKNRTPLHYAFVKIQDWSNTTQIDPIETVSSICGCKGLELDIPDKWQKTPLHYASQRGASICAMYLIQRGANIERKDIYGNTPLGVGLMNTHYNYGIILIQKQASVLPLVYKEDPERIKKQWEEEEKKQRELYRIQKKGSKGKDIEMEDDNSEKDEANQSSIKKKKKHRNMFKQGNQGRFNDYYGEYDDEYDEEEEDDYDDEDVYQENVFNQQNAFGINVYKPAKKVARNDFAFRQQFGGKGINPMYQQVPPFNNVNNGNLVREEDKEGVSMFKVSIRGGQQGLAYLMLDNSYDLMLAMQDAMDEKKFMLVLTLLSKNPNDEVVQQKNKKGQNLFHILSMNASSCSLEHLQRIYEALLKRGVDVKAKDNFGRNALHYAVIGGSQSLVQLLLDGNNGYNPNEIDNEGHTPLSLCLKGKNSEGQYYNPTLAMNNIFMYLVKSGADVNFVYPEESFKPAFKDEDLDDMDNYDPKGKYYTSPLINLIRQNPQNEVMRNNLIGLIEYGAKLNILDSDGRDPIMHSVIMNNTMVLTILLENKRALNVNPNGQDKALKSAAHYVVNPLGYGSYENVEILRLLHKFKFNLKLQDAQRRSPASYAAEQESGVLIKEIAKLTGSEEQLDQFRRAQSMVENVRWPEHKVDFELDAEQYMDLAHEREKKLAKEKEFRVPVDKTGHFEKSYSVYYDENDHPWDAYMTKVDLKNGIYGDYVFYKMQLLHDTNRDLYVVFTRYGRIGENGMNQRTPFNNLDEAKQDFKKIFKQKTGGNNFEELDKFSRVKKKYNIARVNYITVNFKDYLQPFDFEKCPKSKLSKPLYELFEEISNVTMYQRAMNQFGLDTEVLPFSGVKRESLVEARQILMEITEALNEDQTLSKEGIKADFDALTQVKERICELSSRYYELIPQARYKDQIAPPLNYQHLIKAQYDIIDGLTNIEYASKMLLAALFRQEETNPIDYVFQALNLLIDPLDKQSPEFDVINKYIENTKQDHQGFGNGNDQFEIANIFKFQRKGEAEMIQTYKEVPNHFLLFHGSAMFNFIGILSQGLRIAPPEAPATGYMFGKGIYFADMFEKSFAYAQRGYAQQDSYLMLMCEVVLGKSKELYNAEYIEKLEHPFSSVKGCGRRGPGYKHTVVCPNGVKIPLGKVINYHETKPQMQKLLQLQHNEYIVYNTSQIRMRYIVQVQKKDLKKKK